MINIRTPKLCVMKPNPFIEEIKTNPFEIQEANIEEADVRNLMLNFIIHALKNMEISKTKCIFISEKHLNRKLCVPKIQYAKEIIRKNYPALEKAEYKTKAIEDVEKKYLGTRVWRTN